MFRDFDLTKDHLTGTDHYCTPRTRDDGEAQRRRELHKVNKNLVVLEGQTRGIGAAMMILASVPRPEDRAFAGQIIAESSVNSAWYTAARDANEMRKRLKLPQPVSEFGNYRADGFELFQDAQIKLARAKALGERLVPAMLTMQHPSAAQEIALHLGQETGGAGLYLANVALADEVAYEYGVIPSVVQNEVRQRSTALLRSARDRTHEIGAAPSLAQLAHRDSPLAVWWRNNAPEGAYKALNEAQEEYAIAA